MLTSQHRKAISSYLPHTSSPSKLKILQPRLLDQLRLPTDGTFDQLRPLYRLVGFKESYCFDLKSATDRWLRSFQLHMLGLMFGYSRAESVVGLCLGDSVFYLLPPLVKRSSSVDFVTGQPLGYLASWLSDL